MQMLTKNGTKIDANFNTEFDANPYVEINTSIDIRLIKNFTYVNPAKRFDVKTGHRLMLRLGSNKRTSLVNSHN
jgi:hypothetical protein